MTISHDIRNEANIVALNGGTGSAAALEEIADRVRELEVGYEGLMAALAQCGRLSEMVVNITKPAMDYERKRAESVGFPTYSPLDDIPWRELYALQNKEEKE